MVSYIVFRLAQQRVNWFLAGYRISFNLWFIVGFPFMIMTVVIGTVVLIIDIILRL